MGPDDLSRSRRRFQTPRRRLIEAMRADGIDDLRVLQAFDVVARHRFLPREMWHRAYANEPVPIGFGQTASKPYIQARYLQRLDPKPNDRVLEVGTGSGFQTALLAYLAGQVYSIERVRALSVRAREVLDELKCSNVALLVGDGTVGWSRFAPYDAILVAAGAPKAPDALIDQLAPGGRMLIPLGDRHRQQLTLIQRTGEGIQRETVHECGFVPLVGQYGWQDD